MLKTTRKSKIHSGTCVISTLGAYYVHILTIVFAIERSNNAIDAQQESKRV